MLRHTFRETRQRTDRLWLLAKDGHQAVGLVIAAIHTDSRLYKHRQWVDVEALYVAPGHRCLGIGQTLLTHVYAWADERELQRVQLYVTASNLRAQSLYTDQGFTTTQSIMCKSLA